MALNHLSPSKITLLISLLVLPLTAISTQAQYVYPTFKKVSVMGNARGMAEAEIEYISISNASKSTILTHINNLNRKRVFGDEVLYVGCQAAANKMALELVDYYYDDIIAIPSHSISQNAQVIRGGKYVVFYTDSYIYLGGASGLPISAVDCYNLQNGNMLNLSYLASGSWKGALRRAIYNKCRTQVEALFCTSDELEIPTMCGLTKFGVQFFFATGEIAPNMAGSIIIELSDDELRSLGVPVRW